MNSSYELHDAILESFIIDWESGSVKVLLRTFRRQQCITARGLQNLVCPRFYPWGPSANVNKSSVTGTGTIKRFEIEMQSGDIIQIDAQDFSLSHTDGN